MSDSKLDEFEIAELRGAFVGYSKAKLDALEIIKRVQKVEENISPEYAEDCNELRQFFWELGAKDMSYGRELGDLAYSLEERLLKDKKVDAFTYKAFRKLFFHHTKYEKKETFHSNECLEAYRNRDSTSEYYKDNQIKDLQEIVEDMGERLGRYNKIGDILNGEN